MKMCAYLSMSISVFEADLDDPSIGYQSFEDYSYPQLDGVCSTLERALGCGYSDLCNMLRDEGGFDLAFLTWEKPDGLTASEFGRPYAVIKALYEGEVVGVAVVQEIQMDEDCSKILM